MSAATRRFAAVMSLNELVALWLLVGGWLVVRGLLRGVPDGADEERYDQV